MKRQPAHDLQGGVLLTIPFLIPKKLSLPPITVVLGDTTMYRAGMPEATVDEHREYSLYWGPPVACPGASQLMNTAILALVNAMSGVPGIPLRFTRKRKPRRCSSERTALSIADPALGILRI